MSNNEERNLVRERNVKIPQVQRESWISQERKVVHAELVPE